MTSKQIKILLDAMDECRHKIIVSLDKFENDVREILTPPDMDGFIGTKESLDKLTIHPQDIADEELKKVESEADYINQRDEDLYRDNKI